MLLSIIQNVSKSTTYLKGSNSSGFSHKCGDLCKFHTDINKSAPFPIGKPPSGPFMPGGSTSSPSDLRIKIGGYGYSRNDSASVYLNSFSPLRSSIVGVRPPTAESNSARTLAAKSGCWAKMKVAQVRTAAVVSWPAINIVIKSSLSCLLEVSSPRRSTRKRRRLGSWTWWCGTTAIQICYCTITPG